MIGAFAEAVRATTQACTILLLAPAIAIVVATRCRWQSLAAAAVAAVAGGVTLAAGWFVLDGGWLRLSAVGVVAVFVVMVAAPRHPRLAFADGVGLQALAAAAVTYCATLWWRPCVGTELGVILTRSRRDLAGQIPGMAAYMLGAMVPVAFVVLLATVVAPRHRSLTAMTWIGATVGVVLAGALVVGRHDDLVVTLNRMTTG